MKWYDALGIMYDGFRVCNPDFRYIEYFYKNDAYVVMVHFNDNREWPFYKTGTNFQKMCKNSTKWEIWEDSSDLFDTKPSEPWNEYLGKIWAFFELDKDVMPTLVYTGETPTVHNVILYVKDSIKALALRKIIKEDVSFGEHVVRIVICNTSHDIENKEYKWSKKLIELNDSTHIFLKVLSGNKAFSNVHFSFKPGSVMVCVVFKTKIAQCYAEDIFNIPANCMFTNCENDDVAECWKTVKFKIAPLEED